MNFSRRHFLQLAGVSAGSSSLRGADVPGPVTPWKSAVTIRPVSTVPNRHTIHTYFNVSPETMDGSRVLYYTSVTPEGHTGEVRMQDRATGKEIVLVRNLDVEDAHRVACQQWISNDRKIIFHDLRNGEVVVATVDVK